MHKIVVLDGYTLNPGDLSWNELEKTGEVRVYDRTCKEDVIERIGDSDIVLTNKTLITREIIESCPDIRYIGCLSTGYNVVDLKAARERGIVVTNIPAYGTEAVAQFTMALLLEITSRVGMHSDAVKNGQWSSCPDFCFWNAPMYELNGKTMGIVGFGAIGQSVARKAEAFGMEVLAYRRTPDASLETEHCHMASMEEIYEKSDIISLHCPLTEDNYQMINKDTIGKMKDGVILLNTGRGGLLCEADVREALDSGKIRAAGVDVASTEPIRKDNPLLQAKNIWITPHIAWAPRETRQRLMEQMNRNLNAFLKGEPVNQVQ
ncbi:MAG: D-2-hydroxyacid dehydrogenase [Frisingicoccus sp.]|uniref:D-2-hydroxyacid dehydrogenase n=1 Tax=Frisingicoccus sp. TaxID=1918627 RepID=UPI002A83E05C|nr:D-2-hydroxyacid dehydrogenase [Frisingicoccus sp.]MDY4835764.1 D-2-hydroxyacid dehydrogenase [Frisingicoccus sp.]